MNLEKLAIQGRTKVHESLAASVSRQQLIDMRKKSLQKCFQDFFSHDHRLEFVASIHNVDFVDDSKADNINSTWYSLESMNSPVIWLAYSDQSYDGYAKLADLVMKKVNTIICIGNNDTILHSALISYVKKFITVESIAEAVQYAFNISKRGDSVLFSPSCTVENKSFSELGDEFRQAVNKI